MNLQNLQLIVCGTDTDVGKTIVSSFLVQGLNAIYWKPIQSGLEDGSDTNRVCEMLNLPQNRWFPERYKFKAPVSPHWAAERENQCIIPSNITVPSTKQPLVIETAGGVMVPLNRKYLQIDLLEHWKIPIILVARSGLGTLNHTLLTIESIKKRNIPILGIILNGPSHEDNPRTLEQFSRVPIIAELPKLQNLSAKQLQEQWIKQKLAKQFKSLTAYNS